MFAFRHEYKRQRKRAEDDAHHQPKVLICIPFRGNKIGKRTKECSE
jgi:hypothetical protein